MSVIKNKYPILERDTDKLAVIMANSAGEKNLPQKCVFAFLGETIENYASKIHAIKIDEYESIIRRYPVYKTIYKGEKVCFCESPVGAAASVQMLEFLISRGVNEIIACGSAGALLDFDENEVIIPVKALRDEGTSYHYLEPSREIGLNSKAIEAIKKASNKLGLKYVEGKTWSTDGFFRETREMVKYRIEEGCIVVEMECSALAACASFRNSVFGQILFTADTLANLDSYDRRAFGISAHEMVLKLAFEAVTM
ncbi:nucleoside phosphorylase [Clostridium felsineum]|uniref:Uridine phosphorylase n=1 Tax=Clostridium felsineum TaxID=36839 RepID=A0A1S8L1H4_9CLOT|nr:nucleoside phosphorylase [Clostridium felsineum]URZ08817.1 Purine nucleoside phosphorylase DeoD-type [Clostridium felsineum]URZ09445.1 Purine nucleoside phosphorylase DeoD-type [Clostridium felsineum]URZ14199.1 Purine nucleoside phosphorylase DeoD-type [Clostridium felsineum DSM 794]